MILNFWRCKKKKKKKDKTLKILLKQNISVKTNSKTINTNDNCISSILKYHWSFHNGLKRTEIKRQHSLRVVSASIARAIKDIKREYLTTVIVFAEAGMHVNTFACSSEPKKHTHFPLTVLIY